MPYTFDFDPGNRIARCRFEGQVTDDEFRAFYAEAGKYVELVDPRAGVVDLSDVTSLEATPETIAELAKLPPRLPDQRRPRVVIAPAVLAFGIMRVFEKEGGPTRPNLYVVRTRDAAWSILGIKQPQFTALKR